MTGSARLLVDAKKVLDRGRPGLLRQAEQTGEVAGKLGAAANWLVERSIGENIGDRAWEGAFRSLYSAGLGLPSPGLENEGSSWAQLTEAEARALIEKQAGNSFDALDEAQKILIDGAARLRRDVLACLEPIAQDDHFAFARDGIAEVRKRALNHSASHALKSMSPTAFIVEDVDAPIRPPLHLLYVARATAAKRDAAATRTMLDDLDDLVTKMRNRAQLGASPAAHTTESAVRPGGQPGARHITDGAPSAPSVGWVLVGALDLAAVILAFLFGAPAWASAAVGAAALAVALLHDRLIPRPTLWAVALCGLAGALAGFSAEGVRATFFESTDRPHRYVVDIPEVDGVRRRMTPSPKAEELLGGPLVVGNIVLVACLEANDGYEWAQLERDGSWVPFSVLRLAPGGKAAPRCD